LGTIWATRAGSASKTEPLAGLLAALGQAGRAVDVAENEMASEPRPDRQAPLQIHAVADVQVAQGGEPQRFGDRVESRHRAVEGRHGLAAASQVDRVAEFNAFGQRA